MNNIVDDIKDAHAALTPPPLKELAQKKAKEMTDQLNSDLPVFEQAGFGLVRMDIEIGITPNVTAMFAIRSRLDEAQKNKQLKEVRSNRRLHTLLTLLFKSEALIDFVDIGELECYVIKITLGTRPTVTLVYQHSKQTH